MTQKAASIKWHQNKKSFFNGPRLPQKLHCHLGHMIPHIQWDWNCQHNPYRNPSCFLFYRQANSKIHIEIQRTQNNNNNNNQQQQKNKRKEQSWKNHISWVQKLLQNYSNQDSVVLPVRIDLQINETQLRI